MYSGVNAGAYKCVCVCVCVCASDTNLVRSIVCKVIQCQHRQQQQNTLLQPTGVTSAQGTCFFWCRGTQPPLACRSIKHIHTHTYIHSHTHTYTLCQLVTTGDLVVRYSFVELKCLCVCVCPYYVPVPPAIIHPDVSSATGS